MCDQINAALVSARNLFQNLNKIVLTQNIWTEKE